MVDILIIIFVAAGFFAGIKMGLLRGISGPLGIILGMLAARRVYPWLVGQYLKDTPAMRIIVFIIVIVIVSIVVINLGRLASKLLKTLSLHFLDSLLGGVFGFLLSVMLCGLLLHLSLLFFPRTRPAIESSGLARKVLSLWFAVSFPRPRAPQEKRMSEILVSRQGKLGIGNSEIGLPHFTCS